MQATYQSYRFPHSLFPQQPTRPVNTYHAKPAAYVVSNATTLSGKASDRFQLIQPIRFGDRIDVRLDTIRGEIQAALADIEGARTCIADITQQLETEQNEKKRGELKKTRAGRKGLITQNTGDIKRLRGNLSRLSNYYNRPYTEVLSTEPDPAKAEP